MAKNKFWRYENVIILLMFLVSGLIWMDRLSIAFLFPYISKDLKLDNTHLGLAMSAVAFTWAVSGFVFSFISDLLGKKKVVLVIMTLLFSLSTLFSGVFSTFAGLILMRFLMGIAEGPVGPIGASTVMSVSSEKSRGFKVGFFNSSSALLGNSLTPIVTVALAEIFDWRIAFYVLAAPGIILALILLKYMKESSIGGETQETRKPKKVSLKEYKEILTSRNVWLSIVNAVFFIAGLLTLSSFLPQFIHNVAKFSPSQSSVLFSAIGLAGFIWMMLVPYISDKVGRKKTVLFFSFINLLIPFVAATLYTNYTLVFIVLLIFYIGQAFNTIILLVIPGESVSPALSASAIGLVLLVGELIGGTFGPTLAGILADKYNLFAPLWLTAGFSAIVFLVSLGYKESAPVKRKQEQRQKVENVPVVG